MIAINIIISYLLHRFITSIFSYLKNIIYIEIKEKYKVFLLLFIYFITYYLGD